MFTRIGDINRMFDTMGLLRNRLDNVFSDFDKYAGYGPDWSVVGGYPRTNLLDKGDHFELVAEIPGMPKDDLQVKIQGNYLEISGTKTVTAPDGYRIHRRERGSASFTRSLTLPAEVNSEKAVATMKDGILTLKLPKSEAAKLRQISIK